MGPVAQAVGVGDMANVKVRPLCRSPVVSHVLSREQGGTAPPRAGAVPHCSPRGVSVALATYWLVLLAPGADWSTAEKVRPEKIRRTKASPQ